jgi:hypothetical protein
VTTVLRLVGATHEPTPETKRLELANDPALG